MNPALAALVLQLEQKGVALAVEAIEIFAQDVINGKDVVTALNDVAMTMAEKQAALLDSIVAPG